MSARLEALLSSLGFRLLVPILLTVAGVHAVHAVVSFRSTREHYRDFLSGEARRSSGLIRRATHDGMLLNRLDDVQSTIERLAEGPEVAAIRVYDREGTIVLSSNPPEIGQLLPLDATPCARCHGTGTPLEDASSEASDITRFAGEEVVRHMSVIENEPACSSGGCHVDEASHRVLGVLDVEMSMLPMEHALASVRRQIERTTLVLILVIGLVATAVYLRLVRQPIRRLHEGTQRIAAGDLSTRIDVEGRDELALLTGAFNRMAEDLSRAKQALTEWSLTLEDKVARKTAELRRAERQVQQMDKMASLGTLSATVAHELNNPLSGVLTYARLVERELCEQSLPDAAREEIGRYLSLVQQECLRCGAIVKNLLLFARRTTGEVASIDLNDVVDRSLMLVRHHLEIRGIRLHTEVLEGNPHIVADAGELEQALVALLVNAAEAMAEGGDLTVRLRGRATDVHVEVQDTGVGISDDELPHIFEPFFSTKDKESGVGLGLAVVYGIVHRHGGTIEVESERGIGTMFRIRLPRNPGTGGGAPAQGTAPAATAGERA